MNGNWPDYVFSEDYKLTSLFELEKIIALQGHLPGIPTSKEIELEGQNVGEIQRLQMEKIEELYLYIIQLNNFYEELKRNNEDLQTQLLKIKSK